MLRNTEDRWGWLSKSFHWIIAFAILVMVPVGYVMGATYALEYENDNFAMVHMWLSRVHQSLGLIILIAVTFRLGWRLHNPSPNLPAGLAAYQRWLARLNHVFLYALLFVLPLSGWASLSAYGEAPTYFLWIDGLPNLVPKRPVDDPFGFSLYSGIHHFCIDAGAVLLSLHVVAALWHEFVKKDSVLRRMWPLTTGRAPREPA
ncbi:MAG: cytochrome b [Rhodobacteraceae bacterium]|nr:cytochrome b [Paracoccaceae bacterium]